jgi:diguanylate cyclase (GGDEF)-like protein
MRTWDEELAELRREFLEGGAARVDELMAVVDRLADRPGDHEALHELKRHFHRLAGAGGTYGCQDLSELARQGERLCEMVQARGQGATPVDLEQWRGVARHLREAFAARADDRTAGDAPPAVPAGSERRVPDVLVVDADPQVRSRLVHRLEHEGIRVRQAATAVAARAAFDDHLPDGAIVDITLPDERGYAVVEDLRARPQGDVPVVLMLSLSGDFVDQTEAIHAGADGCFEKPVDWEALVARLLHLLERTAPDSPRVLVVEDDPSHAAYVQSVLESAGYVVRVCDRPRQFDEALAAFRPELIVMDINLPEISGYELARYVRQGDQYATLPIVFLTAESQVQARIKTVKAGGDDFILKPAHPSLLIASVAARLERARFLRTLLSRDGLTRLLTHSSFMDQAQAIVAQKLRGAPAPASRVLVDVDHFKTVNDTYGHQAGDRVLVALSTLLRRHLRRTDLVGRYGGEEFGIVLDQIQEREAARLMLRLLYEFGNLEHRAPGGQAFRVSFSAGVATFDPRTMDLERWIHAADAALYAAKRAGRSRVVTHGDFLASLRTGYVA